MGTSAYSAVGQESPKLCSMEWKYSTRGGGGGLKGEWSQNPATQSGSIPQCHHETATGNRDDKNATTCIMRTTERLNSGWLEMMIYKFNNQRGNQHCSDFWYHDIKLREKCSNSQVDKDMVGLLRALCVDTKQPAAGYPKSSWALLQARLLDSRIPLYFWLSGCSLPFGSIFFAKTY